MEETFSAPIAVGTGDLTLGANPNWVDGEKFQGMITDVRIWTVARTEEEIKIRFELLFRLKKREPLSQLEHAGRRRHDIEKLDAFE